MKKIILHLIFTVLIVQSTSIVFAQNKPKDGLIQEFYDNGNIAYQANYKDGLLNGAYNSYYSNGNPKSSGHYENGVKQGPYKTYSYNGMINLEGNFINGLENGTRKFYHLGDIIKEENLLNGHLIEIPKIHYKNLSWMPEDMAKKYSPSLQTISDEALNTTLSEFKKILNENNVVPVAYDGQCVNGITLIPMELNHQQLFKDLENNIISKEYAYYFLQGTLKLLSNENYAAAEFLQKAIDLFPNYSFAYFNLGAALLAGQQVSNAEIYYQHAHSLDPKRYPLEIILTIIGTHYAMTYNNSLANDYLQLAATYNPSNGFVLLSYGDNLFQNNDKSPNHPDYQKSLELINQANELCSYNYDPLAQKW